MIESIQTFFVCFQTSFVQKVIIFAADNDFIKKLQTFIKKLQT